MNVWAAPIVQRYCKALRLGDATVLRASPRIYIGTLDVDHFSVLSDLPRLVFSLFSLSIKPTNNGSHAMHVSQIYPQNGGHDDACVSQMNAIH